MPPNKKNTPRFFDYRQRKLPLDVALSFGLPAFVIKKDKCGCSIKSSNSSSGSSSARELILSGRVLVNKVTERSCHRIVDRFDDQINVILDCKDDGNISIVERPIVVFITKPKYYVCYKPRGVVCSRSRNEGIDREDSVLISDWLVKVFQEEAFSTATRENNFDATIKTVGRLDEESEGILLLTNDGSFSRLLCDPEFGLMKTYRVVVRGCCYSKIIAAAAEQSDNVNDEEEEQQVIYERVKRMISEMIQECNYAPTTTSNSVATDINCQQTTVHHFIFSSCSVLDVGTLPSQHSSDDSYHALIDLVLCDGKRHAVRRICNNAHMRVCYLSRIAVEGLDDGVYYGVSKPESIVEAHSNGFIPGGRHRDVVVDGKLISRSDYFCQDTAKALLHAGNVVELRDRDVDRIFRLLLCRAKEE
jgi:pseudouridine synthase